VRIINSFKLIPLIIAIGSCQPDLSDDPIPYQNFPPFEINLSNPKYISLVSDGGYMSIDDIGVRGVIIYRKTSSIYLAFERNCSYQPSSACATVDNELIYMKDSCCGSFFNYSDGKPIGGPAWRPLQQYRTTLSGTILTITDEVI
jgi:hypothetical protein